MAHSPDLSTFRRLAAGHATVPVYRQLLSDTLTPVSAFARLKSGRHSFLFESVIGGERVGRFSFLGADPQVRITAYGTDVTISSPTGETRQQVADPLQLLQQMLDERRSAHVPGLPRFTGGAVGYAGYDTIRYSENLPNPPSDDRQLPDLSFAFYDRMVIFDHIRKTILVVAHVSVSDRNPDAAYAEACAAVDQLCEQLHAPDDGLSISDVVLQQPLDINYESNFTRTAFEQAVRDCQEYIRAGDIFQVVLSQRLALQTAAQPFDIYRALRVVNPSPFMFYLRTPEVDLVGSSPEIMVRVEDGRTTIRPLAGTRRRGATDTEDLALEAELLADEKERAEHVMLVDLARNDVGRVVDFGTVELTDVMKVERYSHVMHITSNVSGQLAAGKTALDALRAGLPAGTVSGAPKVRAMEIIDEQEPHRRGPYGGAVGYIDYTGNMDTCIALRTLVVAKGTAYVQAGAGIVADSVPAAEYEETLSKARGLLTAIALAESFQPTT